MTTWERIEPLLRGLKAKRNTPDGQQYLCFSPLRDEHKPSFTLIVASDGEHGGWHDWGLPASGSLYQLAAHLGIEPEGDKRHRAEVTKRRYQNLKEYAEAHGGTCEMFEAAGWRDGSLYGRPALLFSTKSGVRARFLDGDEPRYLWEKTGAAVCWYGMRKMPTLARDGFLITAPVLCNGEASTVVAQSHGIPAFAATAGEGSLTPELVNELKTSLKDAGFKTLIVALDCDKAGRRAALKVAELFGKDFMVLTLDLGFTEGGDLADFCKLHGDDAAMRLAVLIDDAAKRHAQMTAQSLADEQNAKSTVLDGLATQRASLRAPIGAPPIMFPFHAFHRFEGFCRVLAAGKLYAVIGTSGGMKTSLLECFNDVWRAAGVHSLWYGTEWTAAEMAARAIQRFGGATWTQQRLHQVWLHEQAAGTPIAERQGVCLSDDQISYTESVIDSLASLPGQLAFLSPSGADVDAVVDAASNRIDELARQGKRPRVMFIDYLQLIDSTTALRGAEAAQSVVTRLKRFTEFTQTVTWCASQSNKQDSRAVREGGAKLDADSMNYNRPDAFNLAITIKPKWDTDTGKSLGYGEVVIAKQNDGISGKAGEFYLGLDASRRRWVDREIVATTINLNDPPVSNRENDDFAKAW